MFKFRITASKQFSKSDIVDIANALGLKVTDSMSVADLRRFLTEHFSRSPAARLHAWPLATVDLSELDRAAEAHSAELDQEEAIQGAFDAQVAEINNDPEAPNCAQCESNTWGCDVHYPVKGM